MVTISSRTNNIQTYVIRRLFFSSAPLTLIIFLLLTFLLLVGCSPNNIVEDPVSEDINENLIEDLAGKPYNYCDQDSDCICRGVEKLRNVCFIGNKRYYETHIDPDEPCPASDFCNGPEGELVIRCIANQCMQMPECSFDPECGEGHRCVSNRCI